MDIFKPFKNLFNKKEELEVVELNKEKNVDSKETKSSKAPIDDDSAYGIGYGEDSYVTRLFKKQGLTATEIWKCYTSNEWVRSCVDKIVKEIIKYKPVVRPVDAENANDEVLKRAEEVQALLNDPNDRIESFESIRRKYLKDILIYDAGALEVVYPENASKEERKPQELYDVSGINIRLNVDNHGTFKNEKEAYLLISNRNIKPVAKFAKDELLYFVSNPTAGSVYGLSPIETLYDVIQADNQASKLNRRRLDSDGMISGVLSLPGISPKKLKRNQLFWKQQAKKKGASLVVTSSKDAKFIKVSETHQEMQFMEFQRWTLQKIMGVYGLQPIVLGVIDATTGKLNSQEQRNQFKSDAILPLLNLESHHLTDVLIRQGFGYDDLKIEYVEPEQELSKKEYSEIGEKYGKLGVITIDEARKFIGLEPFGEENGGNELIISRSDNQTNVTLNKDNDSLSTIDSLDRIRERIDSLFKE